MPGVARWSLGVWAQPCRGLAMSASQGTPGPGYYSMDYANALVCSSLRGCRPQHGPAKTSGRLTGTFDQGASAASMGTAAARSHCSETSEAEEVTELSSGYV